MFKTDQVLWKWNQKLFREISLIKGEGRKIRQSETETAVQDQQALGHWTQDERSLQLELTLPLPPPSKASPPERPTLASATLPQWQPSLKKLNRFKKLGETREAKGQNESNSRVIPFRSQGAKGCCFHRWDTEVRRDGNLPGHTELEEKTFSVSWENLSLAWMEVTSR